MEQKLKKSAKEKIMETSWELFLTQGYEETTISQILEQSGTSRSAFYHHFHGKDELLFSLAYKNDTDYNHWLKECDPTLHTVDKLISFNRFVLETVEDSPYKILYPYLYGLQVATTGTRHILNQERRYYRILRSILKQGMENGEIRSSSSYAELTNMITGFQIGIIYNWCLQKECFSLLEYGQKLLLPFLESLRAVPAEK